MRKPMKALIAAILAGVVFCSFAAVASAKTTKKKTTTTTAANSVSSALSEEQEEKDEKEMMDEKGSRLEDLTPEEIADIGVGAQIAAGQKPDNVTVVTVTDLLPEKPEVEQTADDNSSLGTAVAVLIALVSVLFVAVGVLYYFAYRAGLFNPDRK